MLAPAAFGLALAAAALPVQAATEIDRAWAAGYRAAFTCSALWNGAGKPLEAIERDELELSGEPKVYASSEHGRRHFCGDCGTGLFYTNEAIFPGQIDVQSGTLDDPDLIPAGAQIQVAERIGWMERLDEMPTFNRYPGMD